MRSIILILMAIGVSVTSLAQIVTITVNGNRNQQLMVNERVFDIDNNTNNLSKTITLNNLNPGRHTLQVVRINDNNYNDDDLTIADNQVSTTKSATTFIVKPGFDVTIVVAANGLVQVRDKQIAGTTSDPLMVLSDAAFQQILKNVQFHWFNGRTIVPAQTAFNNNNYYFTAQQAAQIIRSVAGDDNRLTLAKLAYKRIIDPANFVQVQSLILDQQSLDDLAAFVTSQPATTTISSYSDSFRQGMNETTFDALVKNIEQNWHSTTRVNAVTEMISNETNYFTVAQIRRLLELVDFESTRLQLLKNVYTHIVDPENVATLYSLLATDASKIELINHVKTAAENGGLANYNMHITAMTDARFENIVHTTREHFAKDNGITRITNVFADISNYFSAQQAALLISMVEGELSRLSLAKIVYRSIVDPQNFLTIMEQLLQTEAAKNEFLVYAYSYRGMNN